MIHKRYRPWLAITECGIPLAGHRIAKDRSGVTCRSCLSRGLGGRLRLLAAAAVLLFACQTQADSPPPKAKVETEWVGRTAQAQIYTFKQGANRCYVAEIAFDGVGISCLREEP